MVEPESGALYICRKFVKAALWLTINFRESFLIEN